MANDTTKTTETTIEQRLEKLEKDQASLSKSYGELLKKNDSLNSQLSRLNEAHEGIKAENQGLSESISSLNSANESLKRGLEHATRENQALKSQMKDQNQDPAQPKPKPVTPTQVFEVEGEKYRFLVPVLRHKGQDLTAVDALNDEAILADLVAKDSGLIQRIES